jgi:hypothetical protein
MEVWVYTLTLPSIIPIIYYSGEGQLELVEAQIGGVGGMHSEQLHPWSVGEAAAN